MISDFRFHDRRHTTVSMLAAQGASLLEIADVLGHKTLAMVKRYSHLSTLSGPSFTKGEVLSRTQLIDTAEPDEANESPASGSELPAGWYVLFLNDVMHPYVSPERLQELSIGCTVLGCQVEEHVMLPRRSVTEASSQTPERRNSSNPAAR